MSFPEKFRALIETREDQIIIPDYLWLSFAVCAVDDDSCGWTGWILESAWKSVEGREDEVAADTGQRYPQCGKDLYRTAVEKQFRWNPHAGPKISYPYETAPIRFHKSK